MWAAILVSAVLGYLLGVLTVYRKLFPFDQMRDARRWAVEWSENLPDLVHARDTRHACSFTGPRSIDAGPYVWELLASKAAYAPRDGAGALVLDHKLYLLGGWNLEDKRDFPRATSNDVWMSPDGTQWTQIKPNSFRHAGFDRKMDWEGRHTAGYVIHDGYLWIVGGDVAQGRHQADIWKSRDGVHWQLVNDGTGVPWAPRALQMTVEFNGYIYVMGGQTMPKQAVLEVVGEHYYQDVWRSRDGIQWEKVPVRPPMWSPRGGSAAAVFNGKLWVVGGLAYENFVHTRRETLTDVWSSSDGQHWERVTAHAPWGREGGFSFHDLAVFDGKLWLVGGGRPDSGDTNEIWFTADGAHWEPLPCSPVAPTHATSLFVLDDALVVAAGHHLTREVWELKRKQPAAVPPAPDRPRLP